MMMAADAPPQSAPPAILRAADVRDGLGVNIHVEYTDGGYRDLAQVLNALRFVGIATVRDAAPNPANQGQAGYGALARAGIRFNLFVNGEELASALGRISQLERLAPGSVVAIEGPNEINNLAGFRYKGSTDPHQGAVAYQNDLYAAARRMRELRDIPVATFTDYPVFAGASDLGNLHTYPKGGGPPEGQIRFDLDAAARSTPGRPLIATEIGFPTYGGPDGVSELAQARLLLTSLFDLAGRGVRKTYLYQLLDAYADPGGQDAGRHYGLFDAGYRPKLSAKMLRRLTSLLTDRSPNARAFAASPPALRWNGLDDDVRRLILQKADGEVLALVWRTLQVYNPQRRQDIDNAKKRIDLDLSSTPHDAVRVLDLVGAAGAELPSSTSLVRLSLGGDPLIVQIMPPRPAT